jgi:hypothetical protein
VSRGDARVVEGVIVLSDLKKAMQKQRRSRADDLAR